jgi:hypothetical protein
MWSRACPLLIGTLAGGLILTRRHLSRVQAQLDRARAEAGARRVADPQARRPQTEATHPQTAAPNGQPAAESTIGSALSAEWEQAVPPMDS